MSFFSWFLIILLVGFIVYSMDLVNKTHNDSQAILEKVNSIHRLLELKNKDKSKETKAAPQNANNKTGSRKSGST